MKTDSKHQRGNVWVVLVVVISLLIVLAGGYYYYTQKQAQQKAEEAARMVEEKMKEEEKMKMEEEKMKMEEAEAEFIIVQAQAEALRPLLSEEGVKSLDVILLYVEGNPTVLVAEKVSYPPEVVEAIDIVRSEVKQMVGVRMADAAAKDELIGETATLEGVLMLAQENSPFGPVYSVTDSTLEETFYFLPGDALADYQALEGEIVQITVIVTGVEEGNVLYDVISGPVDAATVTPTTAPVPTEPTADDTAQ